MFSNSPEEWLRYARADLKYGEMGLGRAEIMPGLVCFHAQQAVEKGLKAALLARRLDFPLTHDIKELLGIAKKGGLSFPPGVANAVRLTPFAVQFRYPADMGPVSWEEARQAIQSARVLLKWVEKYLGKPEPDDLFPGVHETPAVYRAGKPRGRKRKRK